MRLFDADALDWWNGLYMKGVNNSGVWVRYRDVKEFIENAPTIDAVPVVRCKDCKHKIEDKIGRMFCSIYRCEKKYDDFCSRGDRK